jgi:hypothetical protein
VRLERKTRRERKQAQYTTRKKKKSSWPRHAHLCDWRQPPPAILRPSLASADTTNAKDIRKTTLPVLTTRCQNDCRSPEGGLMFRSPAQLPPWSRYHPHPNYAFCWQVQASNTGHRHRLTSEVARAKEVRAIYTDCVQNGRTTAHECVRFSPVSTYWQEYRGYSGWAHLIRLTFA